MLTALKFQSHTCRLRTYPNYPSAFVILRQSRRIWAKYLRSLPGCFTPFSMTGDGIPLFG